MTVQGPPTPTQRQWIPGNGAKLYQRSCSKATTPCSGTRQPAVQKGCCSSHEGDDIGVAYFRAPEVDLLLNLWPQMYLMGAHITLVCGSTKEPTENI